MDEQLVVNTLRTLDGRASRIEQCLPSLATKDFVRNVIADAIAPLATKQDLADAIAPLATKVETRQYFEETRRHFEIIAEALRGDMRLLAEGIGDLKSDVGELRRITSRHEEVLVGLQLDVNDLRRDVRALQDTRR